MTRHADYEIKITDPENGLGEHDVYRHHMRGRRRQDPFNEIVYRFTRLIKKTRNGGSYKDLDFFISKKKSTLMMFEISSNKNWIFKPDEDAITFKNAPRNYNISRPKDALGNEIKTQVHLEVPGANQIGEDEFEYSLHYVKPDGSTPFEFDPIINNGSVPPSLMLLFLRITLFSAVISAIMVTAFVAMLIKFGII